MKKTVENNSNVLFATTVRFSDEQRKDWMKRAEICGLSLSALIRKSVLQSLKKGVPTRHETNTLISTMRKLIAEQNAIGVNLNQLTKHANSTGEIAAKIDELLDEIYSINALIYEILIPIQETEHRKVGQYNPRKSKSNDSKD